MPESVASDYGDLIAERIRTNHGVIASRWLERLRELLPVGTSEIFPSADLLDHIPSLIQELSDYVRAPETESVAANTTVLAKAQELGRLRHAQRASVHQLLQEYRILGSILTGFVREQVDLLQLPPTAPDTLNVLARLQESVGVLLQTTVDTFVAEYADTITRQTARLESFSRMVSHELRQPLGALQYAGHLLQSSHADDAQRARCIGVINRNVSHLIDLTAKLETLCLMSDVGKQVHRQEVDLDALMHAVTRPLGEMAAARGVEIRVLPGALLVTLDVARVELILTNLASNAIKYCDPAKTERIVELSSSLEPDGCRLRVRDNGLGIPREVQPEIFQRFYRAHAERDQELGVGGSGLGLFIAQECVEALDGTIHVESEPGVGTTFTVTLPLPDLIPAGVSGVC